MIGRTNTGGGGGGLSPNSAVIHVTAPVGSTISFAKGGVVAKVLGPEKSHVSADDTTLAEWYYAISSSNYGTWTVTATLGSDTASDTVTIDSNKQYDVALSYNFYVFESGRGAIVPLSTDSQSSASVTISTSAITMAYSGSSYVRSLWYNTNAIDFSQFSSLVMEASITNIRPTPFVFVSDAIPLVTDTDTSSKFKSIQAIAAGTDVYTLDLTNINTNGYIGAVGSVNGSFTRVVLYR